MIVCCGEVLIDMLPRQVGGETAFLPRPGGAALNTAVALGRLGAPAGLFSGLSTDLFGRSLRATLSASNVDFSLARISDRPTTLAFLMLEQGSAHYEFHDENSAGRMLTEADLPAQDASRAALHFSGISLAAEPCGSTYEALARREAGGPVVMFDPNIRPGIISDRGWHLARMKRMIGLADIVKVSDEDLAWFGEDDDVEETARRWLQAGQSLVVVTMGADGAAGFHAEGEVRVPAREVEIVDTVGAGDTFSAGLLAWLWQNRLLSGGGLAGLGKEALTDALAFAAEAAAITVTRAGADPPWRHELAGHGDGDAGRA